MFKQKYENIYCKVYKHIKQNLVYPNNGGHDAHKPNIMLCKSKTF